MLWEELRASEFENAVKLSKGVCVVPIGATEKHGPHLPLGTDNMIASQIAKDAAEREEVVVFPTFNFGHLLGFQHHPGSVCLSTQLMIDYLSELCSEIARNGFKKIILLTSHGGNQDMLKVISQKAQESKKDYVVITGNCFHLYPTLLLERIRQKGREAFADLTDEDIEILEGFCSVPRDGGHACFCETLALLAARPELADVSLMNAESGESTHRFEHLKKHGIYSPYFWAGSYPNHYASSYYPGANERMARAMHALNVERIAEMFKAVKEDKELLKINDEWNKKW